MPKVRCMEIIDELEPVARGPYTGSIGYLSNAGDMDLNIIGAAFVVVVVGVAAVVWFIWHKVQEARKDRAAGPAAP